MAKHLGDREKLVGFLFADIARFRGVIYDRMVKKYNLTLAQAHVLKCLYKDDGLTQKTLADRMAIGTVTVSGLVERLEAKGLVNRAQDKADRRAKKVYLTPAAMSVQSDLIGCLMDLNDIAFEGFTSEELEVLVALLRRTHDNLHSRIDASWDI